VISLLRCPHCHAALEPEDGGGATLRCAQGHAFDVARQGYVSLIAGGGLRHHGDTREMVAARAELLDAGHFRPVADAVVGAAVAVDVPGAIVDAGAGTGHYLARALDSMPGRAGLALDASRHAAARAARSHPRTTAVVCDVWAELPVRDGVAALVLNVFAPRNPAEMRRVLHDAGRLVVAHPTTRHLQEVAGLIGMQQDKEERIAEALGPWFERRSQSLCEYQLELDPAALTSLITMGPTARHGGAAASSRQVTVSVAVATFAPKR
jgi:23S rRNA (guanine745-N1)-methyltransferase